MPIIIRPLNPDSTHEVAWVAQRMKDTLGEVLGEEEGGGRYSLEWLRNRVLWHLDPDRCRGEVFLAEDSEGTIQGHCIVRIDRDEAEPESQPFGLFSTTWVQPEVRQQGVALELLARGEQWMHQEGMARAVTFTHPENRKLIGLYSRRGYQLTPVSDEFVRLDRVLAQATPDD